MSAPLRLQVNLANPGQFLACCGLLDMASRIDPQALGWFEDGAFLLQMEHAETLLHLRDCPIEPLELIALETEGNEGEDGTSEEKEDKSAPVRLGGPFDYRLDWWTEPAMTRAGFKTWSGGQTVLGFLGGMREQFPTELNGDWLTQTKVLKKPKPFYLDSRLSRMTALDMGFSTEKFETAFSPVVELLAFIGLQRFRPRCVSDRECYAYSAWEDPLPVQIAAAVAAGLLPTLSFRSFTFPLVIRTGGKYKALGTAIPERTSHV